METTPHTSDYTALLRRVIASLPENTGAARRAVYEKARTTLAAQLHAVEPHLPARETTRRRLLLEECIQQVEHDVLEEIKARAKAEHAEPAE